jgi:hypothetical protein
LAGAFFFSCVALASEPLPQLQLSFNSDQLIVEISSEIESYLAREGISFEEKRQEIISRIVAHERFGRVLLENVVSYRSASSVLGIFQIHLGLVVQNGFMNFQQPPPGNENDYFSTYLEALVRTNRFSRSPPEEQDEALTQTKRANLFVSPLFAWLVEQERESVSPSALFAKAKDIYGDPFSALGALNWILSVEGKLEDRDRSAIGISRMSPILNNAFDAGGNYYHFWGFLIRALIEYPHSRARLNLLSSVFETGIQYDPSDRLLDLHGLMAGRAILHRLQRNRVF